jgi:hypothetical protein
MKKQHISYDEDGDVLYVSFQEAQNSLSQSLSPNIVLLYERTLKEATGLTLIGFSDLVNATSDRPFIFQLNHLTQLNPQKRQSLLDMLHRPPITYYLRIREANGGIEAEVIPQPVLTGPLLSV